MAKGGSKPYKDKHELYKPEVFEYEDFGTPAMYIAAILTVVGMLAIIVLFAMIVASGAVAISEAIR